MGARAACQSNLHKILYVASAINSFLKRSPSDSRDLIHFIPVPHLGPYFNADLLPFQRFFYRYVIYLQAFHSLLKICCVPLKVDRVPLGQAVFSQFYNSGLYMWKKVSYFANGFTQLIYASFFSEQIQK